MQKMALTATQWLDLALDSYDASKIKKFDLRYFLVGLVSIDPFSIPDSNKQELEELISDDPDLLNALNENNQKAINDFVSTKKPQLIEGVPAYTDDASFEDQLNRTPFAEILAARIKEVRAANLERQKGLRQKSTQSFAVHLYGQWGVGKTTILNFLGRKLDPLYKTNSAQNEKAKRGEDDWVVVEFNAWQHQRIGVPWWVFVNEVFRQLKASKAEDQWKLKLYAMTWWARVNSLSLLVIVALFGFVGMVLSGDSDAIYKSISTVLGTGLALGTFFHTTLMGSKKAAENYFEHRSDPLKPVSNIFHKYISSIKSPIAIFIDDLDRCRPEYVIDLLEGIQTLFKDTCVTYVVAADRDWLVSSFQNRYKSFEQNIGTNGRPLGHLFLEKMFQVSVPVPQLPDEVKKAFWGQLVSGKQRGDSEKAREQWESEISNAQNEAKELVNETKPVSEKDFRTLISQNEDKPFVAQQLRTEAAKMLTSQSGQVEAEHVLLPFAELLEPNPRSLKRLVNAYGMAQAINYLSGIDIETAPVALWTILRMRWPILADHLRKYPEDLDRISGKSGEFSDESLADLFDDPDVIRVVRGIDSMSAPLTSDELRAIL